MRESFSVYVHIPYCARRCPYCDFNTYVVHAVPEQRYVDSVLAEAAFAAEQAPWKERTVATVFLGGGTPSLFSPDSIGRLLDGVARLWNIASDAEITMEANPGTLEGSAAERLRAFRAAGINRLSFGAQSFNPTHLATLGRLHGAEDTVAAVEGARRAGFDNVSCDLIFGVPGQNLADWEGDLRRVLSLGTEHVSAYGLTYEEGTPMTGLKKAGRLTPVDEDTELAMLRLARDVLGEAGLRAYEVSNHARPGRESRHNLAYWTWRDYLGLGAGAHGFAAAVPSARIPSPASARSSASPVPPAPPGARDPAPLASSEPSFGRRYANLRLPEFYMSAAPGAWHASEEEVTREMGMAEYLLVGLRLADGIDVRAFERRFRISIDEAAPRTKEFVRSGLLERDDATLRLSARGLEIADAVIGHLAAG